MFSEEYNYCTNTVYPLLYTKVKLNSPSISLGTISSYEKLIEYIKCRLQLGA
jgi:hypothetical protein